MAVKIKKCKVCKTEFQQFRPMQKVCSWMCGVELHRENEASKESKAARKAVKGLKDNDRSHQTKLTQKAFNKYIRLRDRHLNCISCDKADGEINYSGVGGKWDCGHYRTVGACPELRFEELNANKQCKKCNGGSGKYSRKDRSVKEGYDIGLLEKIGQEKFDWVNGYHEPKKYTIEELQSLRKYYNQKCRELEQ